MNEGELVDCASGGGVAVPPAGMLVFGVVSGGAAGLGVWFPALLRLKSQ